MSRDTPPDLTPIPFSTRLRPPTLWELGIRKLDLSHCFNGEYAIDCNGFLAAFLVEVWRLEVRLPLIVLQELRVDCFYPFACDQRLSLVLPTAATFCARISASFLAVPSTPRCRSQGILCPILASFHSTEPSLRHFYPPLALNPTILDSASLELYHISGNTLVKWLSLSFSHLACKSESSQELGHHERGNCVSWFVMPPPYLIFGVFILDIWNLWAPFHIHTIRDASLVPLVCSHAHP
ncbi:hypothetical protein K438DRAFT_13157 [Mycena galopus ATCC 62051]|nr:hypothetical protein K438DRAFT_13157 [Mycena galopus ATCC 62051]